MSDDNSNEELSNFTEEEKKALDVVNELLFQQHDRKIRDNAVRRVRADLQSGQQTSWGLWELGFYSVSRPNDADVMRFKEALKQDTKCVFEDCELQFFARADESMQMFPGIRLVQTSPAVVDSSPAQPQSEEGSELK
jgi:hypothetical protein